MEASMDFSTEGRERPDFWIVAPANARNVSMTAPSTTAQFSHQMNTRAGTRSSEIPAGSKHLTPAKDILTSKSRRKSPKQQPQIHSDPNQEFLFSLFGR